MKRPTALQIACHEAGIEIPYIHGHGYAPKPKMPRINPLTPLTVSECNAIKLRVAALPEGHNDIIDFVSSMARLQNADRLRGVRLRERLSNTRVRFFSRIDELEEMAAKGELSND